MAINSEINKIVKEIMNIDISKLSATTQINTISEWDSFNNLMLITKFQDVYSIDFTASEIEATQTIGSLIALITKKVKK